MIRVDIRRQSDRSICGFTVTGHAEYDVPGKDIVCSGVSAVTIGTVNAVEALLQLDLIPTVEKGYLSVAVPETIDSITFQKCQLLLESMVVMLQSIETSYQTYITMKETII
ncbi:MAG: ribosomal-processing cysteine protease Prp [Paenibacillaceae bacterium]